VKSVTGEKVKSFTVTTDSNEETLELGRRIGSLLADGDVVALTGELGAGKTWFTKGVALGFGVPGRTIVTSPSFALVNEYEGRSTLIHMDLYRLERLSDFVSAGLEEFFYGPGLVVMEWADRFPEVLPERSLGVRVDILDECRREIILSGNHPRCTEIIERLEKESG
jgi:tRNA threonylcarbamoyladenosine biosynthesis protein TsaE